MVSGTRRQVGRCHRLYPCSVLGETLVSTSQLVAQHLPFLRRYARALSGTQAAGDAYVTAMLETLIADPQTLEAQLDPRVGLYKLLTSLWNSVSVNGEVDK